MFPGSSNANRMDTVPGMMRQAHHSQEKQHKLMLEMRDNASQQILDNDFKDNQSMVRCLCLAMDTRRHMFVMLN